MPPLAVRRQSPGNQGVLPRAQLFGFTGTPIFEGDAARRKNEGEVQALKTTEDLFQHRLHEYTITHAIEDVNVLRFHVDCYKPEGREIKPGETLAKRAVVDAILAKHDAATGGRKFNALFATASINDAIEYYALFDTVQLGRQLANPDYVPLNITAVFSPPADVSPNVKQIQEDIELHLQSRPSRTRPGKQREDFQTLTFRGWQRLVASRAAPGYVGYTRREALDERVQPDLPWKARNHTRRSLACFALTKARSGCHTVS